ncbi:hypothetical protein CDL15_Pgr012287 [Punica granatum]|uniref:Uncharacterized protein n=1 Tax=Punica granatum TaxID=22663 RepID=A0A218WR40_PUNGR|nr:hypothetical protein CDL15_Pgr012287 [Punica granatum]
MLGCKGMHVRGARRMGSAARVHGRDAGSRQAHGACDWHTAGTVHPRVTIPAGAGGSLFTRE